MAVIHKGEFNLASVNAPMIPFNCIVDTDYGLLSLINDSYLDKDVFDVDFFNKNHRIKDMVKEIYLREFINPLSICMKDKTEIEKQDQLYQDFMNEKYQDILNLSMETEVYNAIELFKLSGEIRTGIVCNRQEEIDFLKTLPGTKGIPAFLLKDFKKEFPLYSQFYFKSLDDIYFTSIYSLIHNQTVYIADYKFNTLILSDQAQKDILYLRLNMNAFSLYSPYNKEKLGIEENQDGFKRVN